MITARLVHKYQVYMSNGRHHIVGDEPLDVNGTDLGPGPYDFLLASLAACKAMTCRMYAERKGWDLQGMEITATHEKAKAKDIEEAVSESGFVDIFDCKLVFHGDLDEAQRARMLEISYRCPVHRTLMSENLIRSQMVEAIAA